MVWLALMLNHMGPPGVACVLIAAISGGYAVGTPDWQHSQVIVNTFQGWSGLWRWCFKVVDTETCGELEQNDSGAGSGSGSDDSHDYAVEDHWAALQSTRGLLVLNLLALVIGLFTGGFGVCCVQKTSLVVRAACQAGLDWKLNAGVTGLAAATGMGALLSYLSIPMEKHNLYGPGVWACSVDALFSILAFVLFYASGRCCSGSATEREGLLGR